VRRLSGYRPGVRADITPQYHLKEYLFDMIRDHPQEQ
jgi:hypothetical protein